MKTLLFLVSLLLADVAFGQAERHIEVIMHQKNPSPVDEKTSPPAVSVAPVLPKTDAVSILGAGLISTNPTPPNAGRSYVYPEQKLWGSGQGVVGAQSGGAEVSAPATVTVYVEPPVLERASPEKVGVWQGVRGAFGQLTSPVNLDRVANQNALPTSRVTRAMPYETSERVHQSSYESGGHSYWNGPQFNRGYHYSYEKVRRPAYGIPEGYAPTSHFGFQIGVHRSFPTYETPLPPPTSRNIHLFGR